MMIMMIIRMIMKWIKCMTASSKLHMASGLKTFDDYIVNDYTHSYGRKLHRTIIMMGSIMMMMMMTVMPGS